MEYFFPIPASSQSLSHDLRKSPIFRPFKLMTSKQSILDFYEDVLANHNNLHNSYLETKDIFNPYRKPPQVFKTLRGHKWGKWRDTTLTDHVYYY